ncbi:hypothetical protein AVEN_175527-1 [Araneus ventricosus]|uniref:Uncharacterized protein n=1 Tax=Araneus ventricosus TaxID=182803 RepID=A0A4Y2CNC3_ARAVE|nr:hypothetical protein AVEN_175527-1 [Araneus ventricosus]
MMLNEYEIWLVLAFSDDRNRAIFLNGAAMPSVVLTLSNFSESTRRMNMPSGTKDISHSTIKKYKNKQIKTMICKRKTDNTIVLQNLAESKGIMKSHGFDEMHAGNGRGLG